MAHSEFRFDQIAEGYPRREARIVLNRAIAALDRSKAEAGKNETLRQNISSLFNFAVDQLQGSESTGPISVPAGPGVATELAAVEIIAVKPYREGKFDPPDKPKSITVDLIKGEQRFNIYKIFDGYMTDFESKEQNPLDPSTNDWQAVAQAQNLIEVIFDEAKKPKT